jgi:hypothetical protein
MQSRNCHTLLKITFETFSGPPLIAPAVNLMNKVQRMPQINLRRDGASFPVVLKVRIVFYCRHKMLAIVITL